jgi:hypothetical protein
LADLTGLRCGALAAVLRGALAGVLAVGAALAAGLVAALPEDAVLSVLAAFALGAEEMVVSFMVYRLSKNNGAYSLYRCFLFGKTFTPRNWVI